jgi:uncharacterized protein YlxW (UPF0749 family)
MADPAEALGFGHDRRDEYARRDRTTTGDPVVRSIIRILTVVGALVVGYLLAVGFSASRSVARAEGERKSELVTLVRDQADHVDELTATLDQLGQQVEQNEREAAALAPALGLALQEAELAAGVVPLQGPGVTVTVFDAPVGCTGAPFVCEVQDFDLQFAVNTLFASGAEAVAVGDQRVIATTAIRSAGSQITVNYRYLAGPYEISAVGDPDDLIAGMQRDGLGVALEASDSGLRLETRRADDVLVPGIASVPAIRVARPAGTGPP